MSDQLQPTLTSHQVNRDTHSMQLLLKATATLLVLAAPGIAGEYNPIREIGDAAPAWTKLPGTDGKTHSLSDLKDKDVVVVVFTVLAPQCLGGDSAVGAEGVHEVDVEASSTSRSTANRLSSTS